MPSPRELVPTSQPAPAAEEEEEEDPSAMSMEDAYALVLASRRPPEPERRSDVDAKAEEFKENQRQQRLNSIDAQAARTRCWPPPAGCPATSALTHVFWWFKSMLVSIFMHGGEIVFYVFVHRLLAFVSLHSTGVQLLVFSLFGFAMHICAILS